VIFNQTLPENFRSKSAHNIPITIRLKNPKQGSIDPDQIFNRDRDRA